MKKKKTTPMPWQGIRRITLVGINFLYLTPLLFGWSLLTGDLSASRLLGINLVDPLAALQTALASRSLYPKMVAASCMVLVFYMLVGGRSFCSWVCPFHLLAEAGEGIRRFLQKRLGGATRDFSLKIKYGVLIMVLLLSAGTSFPAFETVSPIGIASRNLIYGATAGLFLLMLILLVEIFYARRIWCRSLCPLGALYAALGRWGLLRVRIKQDRCPSNCRFCHDACFVPEILDPLVLQRENWIDSGECTNCGACVDRCMNGTLSFGVRWMPWRRHGKA